MQPVEHVANDRYTAMDQAILYPLDYQLTIGQIIRERVTLLRAKGIQTEAWRLQDVLRRLHRHDFGECLSCGRVIPYMDVLADPAVEHCRNCGASR